MAGTIPTAIVTRPMPMASPFAPAAGVANHALCVMIQRNHGEIRYAIWPRKFCTPISRVRS